MANNVVKVRGVEYRRVASKSTANLGSKFFGKARFLLQAPDGSYWQAYGKGVAWNSTLAPANPVLWPDHVPQEDPA
jgi:hypothetical protein